MNGRSHLSIGEVLSLLQDEFPEVTISKIRFLESQGLVDPERTPSGYRKFYEADIDRLRWVLRQQRDAFLPLKVIKGRLDQQGEDASDEDGLEYAVANPGRAYDNGAPDEGWLAGTIADEEPRGAGVTGADVTSADVTESGTSGADVAGADVAGADLGSTGVGGSGVGGSGVGGSGAGGEVSSASVSSASISGASISGASVSGAKVSGTGVRGDQDYAGALVGQLFNTEPPYPEHGEKEENIEPLTPGALEGPYAQDKPLPKASTASATVSSSGRAQNANHRQPASDASQPDGPDQPDEPTSRRSTPAPPRGRNERGTRPTRTEANRDMRDMKAVPEEDELALEDLVQEGGVDVETVRDLERYGLISPRVIGGASYYTRDAAVIVQLAWAFARHGVEARHLRAYKGAAEREAGLVQQVIMPLIRQRNPEARQAALQTVEELSQLGGELRAALLRSALADLH